MSIKEEARSLFEGMSREELVKHLAEAGFNVSEGTGKITFTDNEDEMLDKYEWTLYITTELLKCELDELSEDWNTSILKSYSRGKANVYKETLYHLTGDDKWQKSLEELKEIIRE